MDARGDIARRALLELRDEVSALHGQADGLGRRGGLTLRARRVSGGRLVIAMAGELDLASAPRLDAELRAASDASLDVSLDLAGLDFFDSTGLTLLLRAANRTGDGAGSLELVAPAQCVRDVVALTRTADALPFARA